MSFNGNLIIQTMFDVVYHVLEGGSEWEMIIIMTEEIAGWISAQNKSVRNKS